MAHVWTFRDGKMARMEMYATAPKPSKPWGWRPQQAVF
jgi:hypothetical protein